MALFIMTETPPTSPTVSIPFIYLRARGRNSIPTKKAKFPSSFQTLMKICNTLFKSVGPIRSIFTQDGTLITSLDYVVPGSTLLVSSQEADPSQYQHQAPTLTLTPKREDSAINSTGSFQMLFGKDPGNQTPTPKRKSQIANTNTGEEEDEDLSADEIPPEELTPSRSKDLQDESSAAKSSRSAKSNRSSKSNKSAKSSHSQTGRNENNLDIVVSSDAPEEEEELSPASATFNSSHQSEMESARSKQSSKSQRSQQSKKSQSNAGPQDQDDEATFDESRQLLSETEEEEEEVEHIEDLIEILTQLLGTEAMNEFMQPAIKSEDNWIKQLLSVAPTYEKQQQQRWYKLGINSLEQFGLPLVDKSLCGYDQMVQYVRSVIQNHRFAFSGGCEYNVRLGITGPRQSGKSQLLSVFASQFLLEFLVSGFSKKTFFVFMNIKMIMPEVYELKNFYSIMLSLTLDSLVWQCPQVIPYIKIIRKYFDSILTSKSAPKFSKSSKFYQENPQFAELLSKIGERLFLIWNDSNSYDAWMTTMFLLPQLIGNAAGFSKVFFIVDNIEYSNIEVFSSEPFLSSGVAGFVNEYLKYALDTSYFVVAFEDQSQFNNTVSPIDEDGVDLAVGMEFVNPMDIMSVEEEQNQITLKMIVQNEPLPISLTLSQCCGIPAFVKLWNEINEGIDEYEQEEEGSENKEELEMLLLAQGQHLLEVMFQSAEEISELNEEEQKQNALFVTSLRRIVQQKDNEENE